MFPNSSFRHKEEFLLRPFGEGKKRLKKTVVLLYLCLTAIVKSIREIIGLSNVDLSLCH